MSRRPQLWVFAGPNGAGKTTLVKRYWVAARIPVVNTDEIAQSITPDHRGEPAIMLRAGKEAARLRREHIAAGRSFAIETTLSGHSELRTMELARAAGFKVNLIFIGIAGPEMSLVRVRQRVREGGHNVPAADIRRRYARTMANLPKAIELADRSVILDNQNEGHPRLLFVKNEKKLWRLSERMPTWLDELHTAMVLSH